MSSHKADTVRIAKNSIYLYLRSIIILVVSLYTSRVVLQALGFEDYGIYSLVGSVVVMFNMFSATLSSSTQRFLNFELGRKDFTRITQVFSASINIYIVLCVFIFILLETIGLYILNTKLVIPENRMEAANWVYQISVITFLINLISLPYNALIIAHEKMDIFAWVSIYEAVMKLIIVYLITISPIDNLVWYSLLIMLLGVSIRLFYGYYCGKYFPECKYEKFTNRSLYKEMLVISGWNFLNSGACILTTSCIGVVVNYFTNVVINSSKGISGKVESVVTQLFYNFITALRPQITQSYASGDFEYMKSLVSRGSRYSFLLMCVLCFPVILYADEILKLWLGDVPIYASNFVQLTLIFLIQNAFSTMLDMVLMATGRLKYPQIVLSIFQILNIPVSCVILWLGYPPYYIYFSYIIISYITLSIRLYFVTKYTVITFVWYMKSILLPISIFLIASLLVICAVNSFIETKSIPSIIFMCFFVESVCLIAFLLSCSTKVERIFLLNKIRKK